MHGTRLWWSRCDAWTAVSAVCTSRVAATNMQSAALANLLRQIRLAHAVCSFSVLHFCRPVLTIYSAKAIRRREIQAQAYRIIWSWYTGRWWVGCYIWYSEEGLGGTAARPDLFSCTKCNSPPISGQWIQITILLYNGPFLCGFCRAMLCKRGLCRHTVSVCLSVTFVDSVKTNKHLQFYSSSGSHTILVLPYQTLWQYFDGNTPNRSVECRRGRHKFRSSAI